VQALHPSKHPALPQLPKKGAQASCWAEIL